MKIAQPLVFVAALASAMFVTAARAETIYRWVDASGQTHFSDAVPDAYKKIASRFESTSAAPSAAEITAAQASAAALKAQARDVVPPAARQAGTAVGFIAPPTATVIPFAYDTPHCKVWRKRFDLSKACYDSLTNIDPAQLHWRGATACGEDVPNPYPTCGAPDNTDDDTPFDPASIVVPPQRRRHP